MRKLLAALLALTLTAQTIASGPKYGNAGGIGSSTSTYSGGEPAGGTYSINGVTGAALFNSATLGNPLGFVSGGTNASTATGATTNLQYLQGAAGSAARSLTAKFQDTVNVADFAGCDATGATDSTACIQSALNTFAAGKGGVVHFRGKYLISSNLTVPNGVSLQGECQMPGSPGANTSAPYGTYTCGVLMVNSAATITLSSGSNLSHMLLYRAGMTFPVSDATLFAGTAVTVNGDDASITQSMILGFNQAIFASGVQRLRVEYLYADNNNGIEITNSLDIDYINHVHMWPFAGIASGAGIAALCRSGNAFYLHDTVDWAHLTDNFSFCYKRGYLINNVNSTSLIGNGADGFTTGAASGNIGLEILGNSSDTHSYGMQIAAQMTAGIHINNVGATSLIGTTIWGGSNHAVLVDGGDVAIQGGIIGGETSVVTGVSITSTTSRVSIDGVRFGTVTGALLNPSVNTSNITLGTNDYGAYANQIGSGLNTSPSVASADPLPLPSSSNVVNVTGNTSFGSLNWGWAGRCVTLHFTNALSVFSSTTSVSSMRLAGNATFTSAANSTLFLCHNGTQWFEVARTN